MNEGLSKLSITSARAAMLIYHSIFIRINVVVNYC